MQKINKNKIWSRKKSTKKTMKIGQKLEMFCQDCCFSFQSVWYRIWWLNSSNLNSSWNLKKTQKTNEFWQNLKKIIEKSYENRKLNSCWQVANLHLILTFIQQLSIKSQMTFFSSKNFFQWIRFAFNHFAIFQSHMAKTLTTKQHKYKIHVHTISRWSSTRSNNNNNKKKLTWK